MFNSGNPFTKAPKPDPDEVRKKVMRFLPIVLIVIVLAILAFDSFYIVQSSDEAVITRFGEYVATVDTPGLHLKFPFIDGAQMVNVKAINRLEFGYRVNTAGGYYVVPEESSMLTMDLNIVIADWAVLYQIRDSYKYLFRVQEPETTLRIIAESTYRRVVASHPLDDILTDQKDIIQGEIMVDLQAICDSYGIGIVITGVELQDAMPPDEVNAAFLDVASAKEEKEAKVNEANKYENERTPVARGEAEKLKNDAAAYREKRINEALGAVARYEAIEGEYKNNPEIMRLRMYMEMIREVLPKVKHIYFVDSDGSTLKFLNLAGGNLLTEPNQ